MDITFDPAWPAHCEVLDCHQILRYQPEKYAPLENRINVTPGEPTRHTYPRFAPAGMFDFGDVGGPDGFANNENDSRNYAQL